ncbi:MAG: hypothetical protein SPL94_04675, partial [Oribacterium sp.]|nr:hypothetical protein [Oribacterium sp.]
SIQMPSAGSLPPPETLMSIENAYVPEKRVNTRSRLTLRAQEYIMQDVSMINYRWFLLAEKFYTSGHGGNLQ